MPQMTPQVSDLLEKALAPSTKERGLLIDHLIDSLDEGPPDEGFRAYLRRFAQDAKGWGTFIRNDARQ